MDVYSNCIRLNEEILLQYNHYDWITPPPPEKHPRMITGWREDLEVMPLEERYRVLRTEAVTIDASGFVEIPEDKLDRFHPLIQSKYRQLRTLLNRPEIPLTEAEGNPKKSPGRPKREIVQLFKKTLLPFKDRDKATTLLEIAAALDMVEGLKPYLEEFLVAKSFKKTFVAMLDGPTSKKKLLRKICDNCPGISRLLKTPS